MSNTPAYSLDSPDNRDGKKPHKGHMTYWVQLAFDRDFYKEHYPNEDLGLGFTIHGTFLDHPDFGLTSGGRTSWIVKMGEPNEDGEIEVETRNSRYTLVGPQRGEEWPRERYIAMAEKIAARNRQKQGT